jgi:hypothetical protein
MAEAVDAIRRVEMRQLIGPFDVFTGRNPKGANVFMPFSPYPRKSQTVTARNSF